MRKIGMIDGAALIAGSDGFEWHEAKADANKIKHGIDFDDALDVFYGRFRVYASGRGDEERWVAIGPVQDRMIRVVFTRRANKIRLISAMRARKNEERSYRDEELG